MTDIARDAAGLLGSEPLDVVRLHGGDLSDVLRLSTGDGSSVVAKSGPNLSAEAEMLRAIREAGAPAPRVLAVSDRVLVLEDLGADEGLAGAWSDLGRALRRLHATEGPAPGWPRDHAFGPVAIPNRGSADWPTFWAENRLRPSVPHCPPDLGRRVERLAARLTDRLPAAPRLSLLHGDLWAGNVMARGGRITGLIDPACYFGDSEVDLAMLTLFGRPEPQFWQAYGTLTAGFDDRQPIYRLWPALVHLRLFGDGYRGLVERCLDEAG